MKKIFKNLKKEKFNIPTLHNDVLEYGVDQGNNRKEKHKIRFVIKFRYVMLVLIVMMVSFLIIDDNISYASYEEDYQVYSVKNESNLKKIVKNNSRYSEVRESVLDKLFNVFSCRMKDGVDADYNVNIMQEGIGGNSPTNSENDSSDTLVQVEGVDEADIVKHDGNHIYVINNSGDLYIFEVDKDSVILVKESKFNDVITEQFSKGSENKENARVDKNSFNSQLYITEKNIITVISYFSSNNTSNTHVCVYEKDSFNISKKLLFNGRNIDTRLTNNCLFLITSDSVNNKPIYYLENEKYEIDYANVYYMKYSENSAITYLISIELENLLIDIDTQIGKSMYDAVYMSKNYLYLVSSKYNIKIKQYVSTIYSYEIKDNELEFFAVAYINGVVENQWYLSEYENRLRVAYENRNSLDLSKINRISVFDIDKENKKFELKGYLEDGIGLPGQDIKSVLFDENKVNIVTYANMDPLYNIIFENGITPIITGKYESPGYSGFLTKIVIEDIEYLVGLGYTDFGALKLSLYKEINGSLIQIGNDLILENSYQAEVFESSTSLFIYNNLDICLYGFYDYNKYVLVDIDLSNENVFNIIGNFEANRCIYINEYLYIINTNSFNANKMITAFMYEKAPKM